MVDLNWFNKSLSCYLLKPTDKDFSKIKENSLTNPHHLWFRSSALNRNLIISYEIYVFLTDEFKMKTISLDSFQFKKKKKIFT